MLKNAILHNEELQKIYYDICTQEKYDYLNPNYHRDLTAKADDWETIQRVSYCGKVIGYMSAEISRGANKIYEMYVFSVAQKLTEYREYTRDLLDFILYLLKRFRKIEFCVTTNNPAMKHWDRFIEEVGGFVVGVNHESCYISGQLVNSKHYELFNWQDTIEKIQQLRNKGI